MKPYTTKTGARQYKPSIAQLEAITTGDNAGGFCLACGAEQDGIEPDTRKGRCTECGSMKVYGAEELMLAGLYHN